MQEYYIRKENDEDSRGPFTLEQLSSLVEAGQVDRTTFYYDATGEKWVEIQSNNDLVTALFPIKKKLAMRPREEVRTVNVAPTKDERPITVEEMLAGAEGLTEETAGKRDLSGDLARNALIGMRVMAVMLVVSAAGLLVSQMALLSTLEFFPIITSPLVIFGLVDLVLALLLFLEVTSVYSLVRIRAVIGVGFFGFYFLTLGDVGPFAAVAVASISLYTFTLISNFAAVICTAILGLAGMVAFAYVMLT